MTRNILFRLAAIGFVSLLLLVPLMQIRGLVLERQRARDAAVADVARGTGLAQRLTGPVLVVPAVRTVQRIVIDERGERRAREVQEQLRFHVLPERLAVDAALATERRRRGIYEARLFRTQAALAGHFQLPADFARAAEGETLRLEPAFLAIGISDIRGIGTGLAARVGGQPAAFESGSAVPFLGAGVHAPLPAGVSATAGARIDFAVTLPLQGTGEFTVTPAGRETQVRLSSPWPHPGFIGQLLPEERSVGSSGFEARWRTSFFATNLQELTQDCARRPECTALDAPRVGVSFLDPVDQYLKSERALKYALLFIALTFAGFLLCEVLRGVALHPVQYGLVGLALALFYLLLLSLAEHLGFATAYALSAAACILLLAFYLSAVLGSRRLGLAFGAGLGVLYALLHGILSSEDYALLLGSGVLFGVLALFMILTRRVDWSSRRLPPA